MLLCPNLCMILVDPLVDVLLVHMARHLHGLRVRAAGGHQVEVVRRVWDYHCYYRIAEAV